MYLLYFDEAGCTGSLDSKNCQVTPVLVITGLIIKADFLPYITRELMLLKKKYFLNRLDEPLRQHHSNWIKLEIKGSDLRKIMAKPSRNDRRPVASFYKDIFELLKRYECQMISRIYVKGIAAEFKGTPVYTSTIQYFYQIFQNFLEAKKSKGVIIGDSRSAGQNSQVSHSVFSIKMSSAGDKFDRIIETPTFAHSENSAGLQLADLLASGMIWPMATETFCKPHLASVHIRDYHHIKTTFIEELTALQYRFKDSSQRHQGGIKISNKLSDLPPPAFFRSAPPPASNLRPYSILAVSRTE